MLSIDDYIDAAIANETLKSDVELGRRLGLSNSQISNYRKRKSLPCDDTMVRMAKMARMDVVTALLHLSWWRTVSRDEFLAATTYKNMIESRIGNAA